MSCDDEEVCYGCDLCYDEEVETDLERAQRKKRAEDRLRAQGKPTLHVSLGDIMRATKPPRS